jgi:hypothetical protein
MRVLSAVVILLALVRADAFPGCGKREPMVAKAGDSCGGPFVCTAPTTCATLDQSIKMPSWESAYVCTKACAADADCDGLGMAMKCTGKGRLQGLFEAERASVHPGDRANAVSESIFSSNKASTRSHAR